MAGLGFGMPRAVLCYNVLLGCHYGSVQLTTINQPKADVTQIANAPGMVHSGCGLLTGSDFSARSMCISSEGSG